MQFYNRQKQVISLYQAPKKYSSKNYYYENLHQQSTTTNGSIIYSNELRSNRRHFSSRNGSWNILSNRSSSCYHLAN